MYVNTPSCSMLQQNIYFQRLSPKNDFQNLKALKEFYLLNSFHCQVPISNQQRPNNMLIPNNNQAQQHPNNNQNASFDQEPKSILEASLRNLTSRPHPLYNQQRPNNMLIPNNNQSQQHLNQYQNALYDPESRSIAEASLRNLTSRPHPMTDQQGPWSLLIPNDNQAQQHLNQYQNALYDPESRSIAEASLRNLTSRPHPISDQHYPSSLIISNDSPALRRNNNYQNSSFDQEPNFGQRSLQEVSASVRNLISRPHPISDQHYPSSLIISNDSPALRRNNNYQNSSFDQEPNFRQESLQEMAASVQERRVLEDSRNKKQDVLLQSSIEIRDQTVQPKPCTSKGAIRKVPTNSRYNELTENTAKNIVINTEEFVCSICEMFIEVNLGVVLKECFHSFCRLCIVDSIEHSTSMTCPFPIDTCKVVISDDQVQSLLTPASYKVVVEKMIDRALKEKERKEVNDLPEIYYLENLEAHSYIENVEPFQCPICLTEIDINEGVVLKNCLHMFCKDCLNKTIEHSEDIVTKCPFTDDLGSCEFFLQDCEFRALASENAIKQQHAKSLKQAELSAAGDAYHCKFPNCEGWVIVDQAHAGDFICEVCNKRNCLACKVVHEGKTCQQYQDEINPNARNVREARETEAAVQQLIQTRQAMNCPQCGIVVQKTTGCNHMVCGACKHQFQWIGL